MIKRRQFIGGLSALVGAYALAGCGGADSPPSLGGVAGAAAGAGKNANAAMLAGSPAASPSGTTIPSAGSIVDYAGATWTLDNGVVHRNGATVGDTYSVSLILWFQGNIWHCGTAGQFYLLVSDGWAHSTDPRSAGVSADNATVSAAGYLMDKSSNTSYRVGASSDPAQIYRVTGIAQACQAAGIKLLVLVSQGLNDSGGSIFASTSAAYSAACATGVAVASALAPYGVVMYECGNELTRDNAIILNSAYAGNKRTDFNNANWPIMREVMRGMMDGVKAAQPGAQCGINFCVADVAAADDLWGGFQPDGSGGHPVARWDFTTWHNYEVYGDIFDIGTDGAGPGFDLPAYCKARFGVPFLISEWNASPEKDENYRAGYITQHMGEFYANRVSHGIQSVMYYELDSNNDTWGIIMDDGSQISPSYGAFQSFVATHPDR